MSQAEDQQPDQFIQEQHSSQSSGFDDIYVPGIGVRAALDDEVPRSNLRVRRPRVTAWTRGWCAGAGGAAARSAAGIRGQWYAIEASLRRSLLVLLDWSRGGVRPEFRRLRSSASACLANVFRYRPRLAAFLIETLERSWQRDRSRTLRAMQKLSATAQQIQQHMARVRAILYTRIERGFRHANLRLRVSGLGAKGLFSDLRCDSLLAQARSRWRAAIREAETYRLRWRIMQVAWQRKLHRTGQSLSTGLLRSYSRLRMDHRDAFGEVGQFRLKVDGLRRSVGALAVLLVILTFVVQIMLGTRR